jgi:hypothetical protein
MIFASVLFELEYRETLNGIKSKQNHTVDCGLLWTDCFMLSVYSLQACVGLRIRVCCIVEKR